VIGEEEKKKNKTPHTTNNKTKTKNTARKKIALKVVC